MRTKVGGSEQRLVSQHKFGLTGRHWWVCGCWKDWTKEDWKAFTERYWIHSVILFVQAIKGAARPARRTPATWPQTPRSSTTSGSSCRSSTPPSTAWARSTTCPPWLEPGPEKRRTSWPPGTRLRLTALLHLLCRVRAPEPLWIDLLVMCGHFESFSVFVNWKYRRESCRESCGLVSAVFSLVKISSEMCGAFIKLTF